MHFPYFFRDGYKIVIRNSLLPESLVVRSARRQNRSTCTAVVVLKTTLQCEVDIEPRRTSLLVWDNYCWFVRPATDLNMETKTHKGNTSLKWGRSEVNNRRQLHKQYLSRPTSTVRRLPDNSKTARKPCALGMFWKNGEFITNNSLGQYSSLSMLRDVGDACCVLRDYLRHSRPGKKVSFFFESIET